MSKSKFRNQNGFTIVEVAVVAPILILMLAVFLNFLITLYTSTFQKTGIVQLISDNDKALGIIRNDLYLNDGFRTAIDPNLSDAYAPSGGWNAVSAYKPTGANDADYRTLIAGVPGTTKNFQDPTRDIVYLNQYGCNVPSLNPPMINDYIYFTKQTGVDVDGTTPVFGLYRRILVDPSSTCGTAIQQQTCPAGTAGCGADTLLVNGVIKFKIYYYAPGNSPTSGSSLSTAYTDPAVMATANMAYINLWTKTTIGGESATYAWIIYIKKLNS